MEFVRVADGAELVLGQMKAVSVDGYDILLANVDSCFYAIGNKCTHMAGSLCKGKLDGVIVTCPRHGARFDITTGRAVANAKTFFSTGKVDDAMRFHVLVDAGNVYIEVGESDAKHG